MLTVAAFGALFLANDTKDEQTVSGIIAVDTSSLFSGQTHGLVPENPDSTSAAQPRALAESVPQTKRVSEDMRGYENREFRFGLLFPKNLNATEFKEQNGALSVTFQDPDTREGFQVYVTPYAKASIDRERFKLDQPSGVFKDPKDVMIDGARGTIFFGHNPIMGDTREVWFIKGGYLYEVATYKELDTWLGDIMSTWKFI